jgi:flagellar biosynthesis/type III secretory pathway chaperone
MNAQVTQLTDVLEEEVSVGEELERNLAAQKQALIDWDVNGLLQKITEREPWLRSLGALENKRIEIIKQLYLSSDAMTLGQLLSRLPQDAPETARLRHLRGRGRGIFTRLNRDERALHELMENLLAHIQEALRPLMRSAAPLYSETGTAEPSRTESALIHSKV